MKALIKLGIMMMLASCSPVTHTETSSIETSTVDRFVLRYKCPFCGNMHGYAYYVVKFEYNGHKYIRFEGHNDMLIHDPDCSCHQKQEQERLEQPSYLDKWSWE